MKVNTNKLNVAIARKCLTIEDLKAAGISKATIFGVLRRGSAQRDTIGKIAKALDMDVTEIIDMD